MKFRFVDLLRLSLKKEEVPSYGEIQRQGFPQNLPVFLVALCFINSALKLLVPLVLQQTYSRISATVDQTDYITLISLVILAIGASQLLMIAYSLMLTLYKLNVKRSLSSRMIANNFKQYRHLLQSTSISDKADSLGMELWMKIGTKLGVYLGNYYESYLNLIFESLNIVFIVIYLFNKLSFSLLFGLTIAGLVMYKTITIAYRMTDIRFTNISLRARRLKILEQFFTRVTEFKMCWLDKWIYGRMDSIEQQYLKGLREIKLLDCWCVALWQFTGVGISSIVITAYFLLGFNESVSKDSVFTPSTFVYLLSMLNLPLNAYSWYIAGMRTALRAIKEIQNDVNLDTAIVNSTKKIEQLNDSLVIKQEIMLNFDHSLQKSQKNHMKIIVPVHQFQKKRIYSVVGDLAEQLLSKLIFLMNEKVVKGYVEENAWMSASSLQTITMQNIEQIGSTQRAQIQNLLQVFQCHDIPLHTNTQNYSGGEKLRISLVRAFHLGEVIVINSNLNSLDKAMKEKVQRSIRGVVDSNSKKYTIFLRDNEEISDTIITFTQQEKHKFKLVFKSSSQRSIPEIPKHEVSPQISKFMEKALSEASQLHRQRLHKQNTSKIKQMQNESAEQKSNVSFSTFKIYYKSYKHLIFIASMLFVTLLSNYYNYYVNTYVNLAEYNQQHVYTIILITLVFAVGLFFRSFYFADANLDEAARICNSLNQNIIMEQLSFYQSQEKIADNALQVNSKSRLICALSSDTQTIADHFPFSTNIFANNIAVILSSVAVILIEVPQIFILIIFLVAYANKLNKVSHKKDEALKIALKQKEIQVYKIVSDIQGGRKYVVVHNKLQIFTKKYVKLREEFMEIEWLSERYRGFINLKYKSVMILFLIVGVFVYSFVNIFTEHQHKNNKSSGLALLIQYTIQLSNYLLFFTMSIWEIKGQAISIERIRPYMEETASIKRRIADAEKVINKISKSPENLGSNQSRRLLDIRNLNFAYQSNAQCTIFKDLSLEINKGDQIIIRGRSGSGKTTLYKLLTSTYPKIINFIDQPFHISFSPQHPLVLPDTTTIEQNLNPYGLQLKLSHIAHLIERYGLKSKNIEERLYEQKIVINNLRAYLHGVNGVVIYDEPQEVVVAEKGTYIIVTHHHQFTHNRYQELVDGKLIRHDTQ